MSALETEIKRLRAALVHIGEQAVEGMFTEHGDCPATYACSAIIAELIDLGMPPKGVDRGGGDVMKFNVRIDCRGFIDRRSQALHARHDELVEQRWRQAVSQNPKERRRLDRLARETAQSK